MLIKWTAYAHSCELEWSIGALEAAQSCNYLSVQFEAAANDGALQLPR
jgi:hypothetical protein